jgi:hypothetical protein
VAFPAAAGLGLQAFTEWWRGTPSAAAVAVGVLGALLVCAGLIGRPVVAELRDVTDRELLALALCRSAVVPGVSALVVALGRLAPRPTAWVPVLALVLAGDLMLANRAFLGAVSVENYREYLAPDELDLYASDLPPPRRIIEPGRELTLRPLVNGRDVLLGYHPISYKAFEDFLAEAGANTPRWRRHWGAALVVAPPDMDAAAAGWEPVALLRNPGPGQLVRDPDCPPAVRQLSGDPVAFRWLARSPNESVIEVTLPAAATLEVAETIAPGWRWRVGEGQWRLAEEVALVRRAGLPAGTSTVQWQYRPASWSVGVFLSAAALALLLAVGLSGKARLALPRRAAQRPGP